MYNKYDDELYKIAEEITECHDCFQLNENCLHFVPECPDFDVRQRKKNIMLVGINPSMPD